MSRFLPYSPDQAYLLPPSVKDELGEDPLSMFLHRVVEGLDLREFENAYSDEGGELYAASLMLKVWLYAYALGMTSARGLEQRIREDLGLRYLPGGQRPDNWALGALRRRQGAGAERRVYASGGDCTGVGVGAFGNGGPRFDAHSGLRFARWDRYRAAFAE
jgi:hypothetical protein